MPMKTLMLGASLCAAIVLPGQARAALSADNFQLRNTGDLVAVCSAAPTDPLATAATNFCQGFVVGVVRVLQEVDAARPKSRAMFCFPANPPTRSAGIATFIRWANADRSE